MNKETLNHFCEIFKAGASANEKHIETLKKELKANGFKICGMSVNIMLDELYDMGMEADCVTYWKTVGLTNFPYSPTEA